MIFGPAFTCLLVKKLVSLKELGDAISVIMLQGFGDPWSNGGMVGNLQVQSEKH